MIKVLSCRFQQYLGPFIMLTVKVSSRTGLFRNLTNHFFHSLHYQKYISYEAPLFLMFKFDVDFRIAVKNVEKVFCFLDNWIRIGCGKFSLLQTEYLPSAVNVLANSPKLLDITKRDIFQPSFSQSD